MFLLITQIAACGVFTCAVFLNQLNWKWRASTLGGSSGTGMAAWAALLKGDRNLPAADSLAPTSSGICWAPVVHLSSKALGILRELLHPHLSHTAGDSCSEVRRWRGHVSPGLSHFEACAPDHCVAVSPGGCLLDWVEVGLFLCRSWY